MHCVPRFLRAAIFLIVPACCVVFIVGPGSAQPPIPPPPPKVELRDAKYSDLVEAVKAQRGKVVVVDVWATTCPPCVKNYPHVLQMQKELGSKGLVCISVSIDLPKFKASALQFLQDKDSTITNFWLNEEPQVWAKRWDVNGPPVVFVFDRAGRRAGKFGTDETPVVLEDIDKLVNELLQAKP